MLSRRGRPRKGSLVFAAFAAAMLLAPASALADAETFTVNTPTDASDSVADNSCDADGSAGAPFVCTLRAAIQEANDSDPGIDADTIQFGSGFNGEVASDTIDISTGLPATQGRLTILGTCNLTNQPCAGINATVGGLFALTVDGSSVEIYDVAVTNGLIGINVSGASAGSFGLFNSWIGMKLDGSAGGNANGVFLGPNAGGSTIGDAGGERNVFANNSNTGLKLFAADNVGIYGNYFGVKADGATQAANGHDIAISGNSVGPDPATGNEIGGTLSGVEAASPACDGDCNLISGATGDGINLAAPIAGDSPAVSTEIQNNHIGLNAAGTGAVENLDDGIDAGAGDANVHGNTITGGSTAFTGTDGDADVDILSNLIGTNAAGTASLDPPTSYGIQVVSANDAEGAQVDTNRISMANGTAVETTGEGADILDNEIGIGTGGEALPGPNVGISVNNGSDGSRVRGNTIGDANAAAIEIIVSDNNSLTGNELIANAPGAIGGNGIEISGNGNADDNLIGDDDPDNANVITGVDGAPIEIGDDGDDGNTIGRNSGTGNGELFADLGTEGFGNDASGPNAAILAPAVGKAQRGADRIKGSGLPGATVRVYRSEGAAGNSPTGLLKFLGETVVGAGGGWKLNPVGKLKTSWRVSAGQTDADDGSSEFALAKKVKK